MVTTASRRPARHSAPAWHATFLSMVPAITTHAKIAFRHLDAEAKAECVQEVVCNCCAAVARLAELDKLDLAYPSVLARFGVAQVKDGRKVGCSLNIRDVLSPYCQRRKHLTVERLDRFDAEEDAWQETIVEDKNAGPAEVARVRIDFHDWLQSLPRRDRRIAQTLAVGTSTGEVAQKFDLSAGRVSQLRRELAESWQAFVGDLSTDAAAPA